LLCCLGALPVPAKAAELDGNCCADLEERIAELEATVVHSSADFTMTGEINRSLQFWDDSRDQEVYNVGTAEINFEASHEFGNGWEASSLIVLEWLLAEADSVDQTQSSEADPDPINGLLKLRNEAYALNRYTIEVFTAISNPGTLFPFERVEGAQIQKGSIGTHTAAVFMERIVFMGGGRNESPAI